MPDDPFEQEELSRGLGYWTVLALAVGSMLGTTLFFGAPIAAQHSGNMLIIAWVILSIFGLYLAALFGELSAMFPASGGAYEFCKQAYGKFVSFIVAWTAWLFTNLGAVTMIIAAVSTFGSNLSELEQIGLSIFIIVLLNIIAFVGIEAGAIVMLTLGVIMVSIPIIIISKGFTAVNMSNFDPFVTFPITGVFVTIFFMAESFFGGEGVTYLAEETRNPRKVIPKALMHATTIVSILGLLMMFIILGMIHWSELPGVTAPVSDIAGVLYGSVGQQLITIGIFLSLIGTAAGAIVFIPRLLLALSRDKLFLGQFKDLHNKFKTPHRAIMFQTVVLILLFFVGNANYQTLLELMVPMAAILYGALVLSVIVLRHKMPNAERPFKAWFVPIGPILVFLFYMIITLAWIITVPQANIILQISLSLIGIGIPLFLLVEFYYDPKMITTGADITAYGSFIWEKLTGAHSGSKKDILQFFGEDIKNKTVLEYGCGAGGMTVKLLEAVGPQGKVIATHFARNYLKLSQKRVDAKKWQVKEWNLGRAHMIHDPQLMTRVHPSITYVDAVVSLNLLSYVQNVPKVLRELYAIMPVGGKLAFVENTNYFHILPDVEWVGSDKAIEKMFRAEGFAVRVVRKKGLLWNRVYIFGIKYSGDTPYI